MELKLWYGLGKGWSCDLGSFYSNLSLSLKLNKEGRCSTTLSTLSCEKCSVKNVED